MYQVQDELLWILAIVLLVMVWAGVRLWIRRGSARVRALRAHFTDGSLSPRNQHYYFAHGTLRGMAQEDPEQAIVALSVPEPEQFLQELWNASRAELVRRRQAGPAVNPEGLDVFAGRVAHRPCVVITMPPPQATTEAHFAAIVLNHELGEAARPLPEPPAFFFTLEKAFAADGSLRTLFCEWAGDTHRTYGDGPPADPRAFLEHIDRHLTAAEKPSPQATPDAGGLA